MSLFLRRARYRAAWLSARERAATYGESVVRLADERNEAYRRADHAEWQLWAAGVTPAVQVAEYRVPCPGHPMRASLIVRKAKPEQGDLWAIINTEPWPYDEVWMEDGWTSIHDVRWADAHRWELPAALAIAPTLAVRESERARQVHERIARGEADR